MKQTKSDNSDAGRAAATAEQTRFRLRIWERIRTRTRWSWVDRLYRGDGSSAEARRTRRYLRQLEAAGIIEMQGITNRWVGRPVQLEFRVIKDALRKKS